MSFIDKIKALFSSDSATIDSVNTIQETTSEIVKEEALEQQTNVESAVSADIETETAASVSAVEDSKEENKHTEIA